MNPEIQETAKRMTDDILKALGKKNEKIKNEFYLAVFLDYFTPTNGFRSPWISLNLL